jgi:hypothetical protein
LLIRSVRAISSSSRAMRRPDPETVAPLAARPRAEPGTVPMMKSRRCRQYEGRWTSVISALGAIRRANSVFWILRSFESPRGSASCPPTGLRTSIKGTLIRWRGAVSYAHTENSGLSILCLKELQGPAGLARRLHMSIGAQIFGRRLTMQFITHPKDNDN